MDSLERLRKDVERLGHQLGWAHLSRHTGIHVNAISRFAAGKIQSPRQENIEKLQELVDAENSVALKAGFVGGKSLILPPPTRGRRTAFSRGIVKHEFELVELVRVSQRYWISMTRVIEELQECINLVLQLPTVTRNRKILPAYTGAFARIELLNRLAHRYDRNNGIHPESDSIYEEFDRIAEFNVMAFICLLKLPEHDSIHFPFTGFARTKPKELHTALDVEPIPGTHFKKAKDGSEILMGDFGNELAIVEPELFKS